MQVAVFHPGTQHSWQTALALQQLGRLAWYATSIFHQPDRFPYNLERIAPGPLARRMAQEFRRFHHPGLDPALVRTGGTAEWFERIAARAGMRELARRIDAWGNRRFVAQIAQSIAGPESFALWGYNGSSLSTFEAAGERGRTCILDRTIGDHRTYNALMDEVADRYGDWFLPVERRIPADQIARDDREYALADTILVGCEAAARTIREQAADPAAAAKVRVLDYCYDEALFAGIPPPRPVDRNAPVRFLFLGLAIPRKGIHLVLEALARLPRSAAEMTIVGDLRVPKSVFAPYADRVTHRQTVARADVPAIMAAHDVVILPSYFEGAGIVLYEALAAGCALIQSDRCAPVVTSETGIMLDRIDSDAVHAAMLAAVEDRDRLDAWRAAAQGAAANYSFARYRDNIADLLENMRFQG
jgi:glycosyltransferase involved in cell wall biosynthesis